MATTITWETLQTSGGSVTTTFQRCVVPGGYLVLCNGQLVFISDPNYTWADGYGTTTTTAGTGTSTTTTTSGGTTTGGTTTGGTTTGTTTGTGSGSTTTTTSGGTTTGGTTTGGTSTTTTGSSGSTTTTTGGTTTGGTTTGGNISGSTSSGSTTTTTTGGTTTGGTTTGGTSTTTTSSLYYIYNSGVQNSWRDYSYNGTFSTDAAGDKEAVLGAYSAISFNNNNNASIVSQNYLGIQFSIKSDGKQSVSVALYSGTTQVTAVSIVPTATFETVTLTWAQLGLTPGLTFTNVLFANPTGTALANPVYVNAVALIVNPNPQPVKPVLPPVDPTPVSGANASVNWLAVKGNKIVDSVTGAAWMGRGVNVEDCYLGGMGVGTAPATGAQEVIRRIGWAYNLGCDYFRLLLQEFDSSGGETASGDIVNNAAYLAAVKSIVAYIGTLKGARVGVTVDIDYTLDPPVGGAITVASIPTVTQLVYSFYQCPWVHITLGNEPSYSTTTQYAALVTTYNTVVKAVRTAEAVVGSKHHMIVACPGVSNYARNVEYFVTNPVQDAYGAVIYPCHIYDSATGDTWQSQYETASASIPVICDEFGPATTGTVMTLSDCVAWQTELEKLQTPYAGWALSMQEVPTMLVDTSAGTNGVGKALQLSTWGLQFVNQLRAAKGLGAVDLNGNPIT